MLRSVLICLLALGGCGGDGSGDVEPGTYSVTRIVEQDTGAVLTDTGGTFLVTRTTAGSLHIDGLQFTGPVTARASDDGYVYESYKADLTGCEAGGAKTCVYHYDGLSVTSPSRGTIHITYCSRRRNGPCASPPPTCNDPKSELGSCTQPWVIDGKRVADTVDAGTQ